MRIWKTVACAAVLLLALSAAAYASDQQVCIDNAVIDCFDNCNDPTNFQECIIGCATGANNDVQNCNDQCYEDPLCLSKCMQSIRAISSCPYVSGLLKVERGAIVQNRGTGFWQQSVRISNTSKTDSWDDIQLVLDSIASGWKLTNSDGTTAVLPPTGSVYKKAGTLEPGQSTILVLQFSRTGTLPFGYLPRVVTNKTP